MKDLGNNRKKQAGFASAFAIGVLAIIGTGVLGVPAVYAAYGDTTTLVGKLYDGDGGAATEAFLDFPEDVAVDTGGNLFIADTFNNAIRKITASGIISTFAGTGGYGTANGAAGDAQFSLPRGVAVDSAGTVFVADTGASLIRKITPQGSVSTLLSEGLRVPEGVAVFGSTLFIADTGNNAVKRMPTTGGSVTTLTESASEPVKLAVSPDGATLFVADRGSHRVLAVNAANGSVSVVAGSGQSAYAEGIGATASFQTIGGVAAAGTTLYVTDGDGFDDKIRTIDLATGQTALLVRDTNMAHVNFPRGIAVSGDTLSVASSGISTIEAYNRLTGEQLPLVAGKDRFGNRDGAAANALFGRPRAVVGSPDRQYLYLAENNKIRRIDRTTGDASFVIGNSIDNYREGVGADARFSSPSGITINRAGDTLYVTDRWNNRIRGITIATQTSFLVAGGGAVNTTGPGNGYAEGAGSDARFDNPVGIAIAPDDQWVYVTDTANHRIRKVRLSDGQTFLVAGSGTAGYADGAGALATFNAPFGLSIDAAGQNLYVADRDNHVLRRVRLSDGAVSTVAGANRAGYREAIGTNAVLNLPIAVAWAGDNRLYFTDSGAQRVRLVELASGVTKLVAGSGLRGMRNGSAKNAAFNNPQGLAVDLPSATLLVADNWNDLIRRVDIAGQPPYADAAPNVREIRPGSITATTQSAAVAYLDAVGAGFRHGAITYFGDHQATTYVKGESAMTVVIPHGKMRAGWYDVEVVNLDGQSDILERAFGIKDATGNVPNVTLTRTAVTGKLVYALSFTGGVLIASGDLDGDGVAEIVTGPGTGGAPHVRVFDGSGNLRGQFFAYARSFRGGITLAVGDVDGDGRDEIVTGTAVGAPHVRVFSGSGILKAQWFAYAQSFRGGVTVATGDVDGDGRAEVITGPRGRSAPHVRVFGGTGIVENQFFSYPTSYRLGIIVSAGDVTGDGIAEIITAPFQGGAPHVRVFSRTGALIGQFFAYARLYRGGVPSAVGDVNGDGVGEIITGTTIGNAPHLRIFSRSGALIGQLFPFASRSRTGLSVAVGDVTGDGVADVIAGRASGLPEVIVTDASGNRIW